VFRPAIEKRIQVDDLYAVVLGRDVSIDIVE
jgi:hypothetical protein